MINSFEDPDTRFLSNFFPSNIFYQGFIHPTVEHAFQAAKTLDVCAKRDIAYAANPGQAKKLGRTVKLREDWEYIKIPTMELLLRKKFEDSRLRMLLLNTNDQLLVEGNTWHDNFWGSCYCPKCNVEGKNHLGILLMKIRNEFQNEG